MAGKKRSANGQVKSQTRPTAPAQDITMADATPPCGQPQPPSSETPSIQSRVPKSKDRPAESYPPAPKDRCTAKPIAPHSARKQRQKLPKLPPNTSVVKRPILHPALASPFSSASSPKTLYITASSPFIPALKRVRKLLAQITRRRNQSAAATGHRNSNSGTGYAEANGRLEARVLEREIAAEATTAAAAAGKGGGEEVFLKATGRAIPRALEIGVYFQGEEDCSVRVEMGNVVAVDDVEVKPGQGVDEEKEEKEEGGEEIPETRIRTVSSVTISIGIK